MSDARNKLTKLTYHYTTTNDASHTRVHVCSVLQPSQIRGFATPWTYFLRLSLSTVIPTDSSTGEFYPRLDVVHPGRAWSSSPACTWHCSLHYLFRQATPLFTIRYDTRCYFNVRSKADMSQLNLPHGAQSTGHGVAIVCFLVSIKFSFVSSFILSILFCFFSPRFTAVYTHYPP